MKRTLGVFSLIMLLFSTFMPSFTYATGEVENEPENPSTPIVKDLLNETDSTEPGQNTEVQVDQGQPTSNQDNDIPGDSVPINQEIQGTTDDQTNNESPEIPGTTDEINQTDENENQGEPKLFMTKGLLGAPSQLTSPAPQQFEDCADLVGENNEMLIKYNCSGDITIPSTVKSIVQNGAFEGITITSLTFKGNININSNAFSGAIFDSGMTINFDNIQNYSPALFNYMIVGENGKLTINMNDSRDELFKNITIRNGGKLNINLGYDNYDSRNYVNNLFNNSTVDGDLYVNGIKLYYSFNNIYLSDNGVIRIGSSVYEMYHGLKNSYIGGKVIFDEGITELEHVFDGSSILKSISFPNSLSQISYSFYESNYNGDILYTGENLLINSSFQKSNITGDIIFSGTNLVLISSFSILTNINGNFICKECGTTNEIFPQYQQNWISSNFGNDSIISGNFVINNSYKDIYLPNGSISPNIKGNLMLSGNNIITENIMEGKSIDGDFVITGNNIDMISASFSNISIGGDLLIFGKRSNITQSAFINSSVGGNLNINSNYFTGVNIFSGINISGDLNISGENTYMISGTFYGSKIGRDLKIKSNIINLTNKNGDYNYYKGVFENSDISGSVEIEGDTINFYVYTFQNAKVKNNILLSGNTINTNGNTFINTSPSGYVKILGNNIDLKAATFSNSKIGRYLTISGNNTTLDSSSFYQLELSGDINIFGNNNLLIQNSALTNINVLGDGKFYGKNLTGTSTCSNFRIAGNLIFEGNNIIFTNTFLQRGGQNSDKTIIGKDFVISGSYFTGTNGATQNISVGGNAIINSNVIYIENGFLLGSKIGNDFNISGSLFRGTNSALVNLSITGDTILNSNLIDIDNGVFEYSKFGRNFSMSGNVVKIKYTALSDIEVKGNYIMNGEEIDLINSVQNITVNNNLQINANIITGSSIVNYGEIGGNLIITGNKAYFTQSSFNDKDGDRLVGKDLKINVDDLEINGASFKSINIDGDLQVSGNKINLQYGTFENSNISGNIGIYGNNVYFDHNVLTNSTGYNIRFPMNLTLGSQEPLNNYRIKNNLTLGGAKTKIPNDYKLNGGLFIEDGDNATANVFEGYEVGNSQVVISGTLSNVGANAYSFKQGTTIQSPIILSDDFTLGDRAFCIQGEPNKKVNAITSKKFTESEKQELSERVCVNLIYSGTHNLLLKVEGKEAIVLYDGINDVIIPESFKKSGYNIKWYSNPELSGDEVDINIQSFNEYEYQKTIYGKYVEIPVDTEPSHSSAGGGSSVTPKKQESKNDSNKVTEKEHNSADTEKTVKEENKESLNTTSQTINTKTIKENAKVVEGKSLTRGEVAVMTNILLEVYPQLTEGKTKLNEVNTACSNYADEQNFTKDEKKAITRLCRLSIMGIHSENNEPLNEFLVKEKASNGEFATIMDRVVSNYNEKDLSVIKDALKKLEGDDENVVFGTVYDVFMNIKSIFN